MAAQPNHSTVTPEVPESNGQVQECAFPTLPEFVRGGYEGKGQPPATPPKGGTSAALPAQPAATTAKDSQ